MAVLKVTRHSAWSHLASLLFRHLQKESQLVLGPIPFESDRLDQSVSQSPRLVRLLLLARSAPKYFLPVVALSLIVYPHQDVAKQEDLVAGTLNLTCCYLLRNEKIQGLVALAASSKAIGFPLLLPEQQLVNYWARLRHMRFHFLQTCLSDRLSLLDGIVFQAPPLGIPTSACEKCRPQA